VAQPFPVVDLTTSGYPLLESRTELLAAGSVSSSIVDTIDMLPVRTSALGPGDATTVEAYTLRLEAFASDSRNLIQWSIYAEGLGGIAAPGELVIAGTNLNPAAVSTPTTEQYLLKRIVIPGPAFFFGLSASATARTMHTGQCVCTSRILRVYYFNGSVAQTLFNIGVYARPLV